MLRLRLDLMISEVFSKLGMGPLEEPNPRPGPGTLQVGQMGQAHNWCPILLWLMPPPCFAGADRQTRGPRCFCSSCNRCSKAEQELQQLLLPGLPEHVATLGPEVWEVAWSDLAEVVEQGVLSCCCSPNARRGEEQHHQSHVSLLRLSPRPHACPDACEAWVDAWEEPHPRPGPDTLQVGQMGQGHN